MTLSEVDAQGGLERRVDAGAGPPGRSAEGRLREVSRGAEGGHGLQAPLKGPAGSRWHRPAVGVLGSARQTSRPGSETLAGVSPLLGGEAADRDRAHPWTALSLAFPPPLHQG